MLQKLCENVGGEAIAIKVEAGFVKEDDGAGTNLGFESGEDFVGVAFGAVETAGVPAGEGEVLLFEDGVDEGVFESGGGAEERWGMIGGEGGERFLAVDDFAAEEMRWITPEPVLGMGHGVVAEGVATTNDFFNEVGVLSGFGTDKEEGGFGVMSIEEVEQDGGVDGIGSVVDGDPDKAGGGGGELGEDGAAPGILGNEGGDEKEGVGGDERGEGEPGVPGEDQAEGSERGDRVHREDRATDKALPF